MALQGQNHRLVQGLTKGQSSDALTHGESSVPVDNNAIQEIKDGYLPRVAKHTREKESRLTEKHALQSFIGRADFWIPFNGIHSSPSRPPLASQEYLLKKLPEQMDLGFIIGEKKRLNKQLFIVSKKVSNLITNHHEAYCTELQRVAQIQTQLRSTIDTCMKSRSHFQVSRQNFTRSSLNIVASYRRREVMVGLLKLLVTIKSLQTTTERLNEVLDKDDFFAAVQIYRPSEAAASLRHFKCLNEQNALCSR